MGKSRRPPETGAKLVSDEDRVLWEHTARTLEPLARRRSVSKRLSPDEAPPGPSRPSRPAPASRVAERPIAEDDTAPPFAEIGRRQARKLSMGQVSIDCRVDLHGMTRLEAYSVLREFLMAAHENGARWTLVITGKGAPRRPHLSRDDPAFTSRESGVLRREVPRWLAEPELRAIVVGFRTAAIGHGGNGALYVQVRQRRDRGV